MAGTYELLGVASADNSGPTTLTVSSIPQTHDDLEIVALLKGGSGNYGSEAKFRINGVTGSYYTRSWWRMINGTAYTNANVSGDNGIAVSQGVGSGDTGSGITYGAAISICYISDYTRSSGGSPDYGVTTGLLRSRQIANAGTGELSVYSWSMGGAYAADGDPVSQFGVSSNALDEKSMIAVYGIKRS
tara:strand:+ start:47 stop:610 length:564 start_codon:yes stop_codon:yes gene_type:complete